MYVCVVLSAYVSGAHETRPSLHQIKSNDNIYHIQQQHQRALACPALPISPLNHPIYCVESEAIGSNTSLSSVFVRSGGAVVLVTCRAKACACEVKTFGSGCLVLLNTIALTSFDGSKFYGLSQSPFDRYSAVITHAVAAKRGAYNFYRRGE